MKHETAWWAAVVAFAGSLVANKIVASVAGGLYELGLQALMTAALVALGVYGQQRLRDAKRDEQA